MTTRRPRPPAANDLSLEASRPPGANDLSPRAAQRLCRWCGASFVAQRRDAVYCERKCRQAAWRLRHRSSLSGEGNPADWAGPGTPAGLVFAYADPPFIGTAAKYYRGEPTYGGEVDHAELIAQLQAGGYAGWALSCSEASLRYLLPLCPPGTRTCPWTKPIGVPPATYGPHNAWEPVLVVGGRKRRPGVRDWLRAQPARLEGNLPGRKPTAFCAWLFDLLGMVPGDELVDLFPGTGIVTRAWAELSAKYSSRHEDLGDHQESATGPDLEGSATGRPCRRDRATWTQRQLSPGDDDPERSRLEERRHG